MYAEQASRLNGISTTMGKTPALLLRMTRRRKIQLLLWAYFWLLIFEGALRKWVAPDLSNVLLVARDPVCIGAIWFGMPYLLSGAVRRWILGLAAIGGLGFLLAILVGHRDVVTAAYGARILVLHFPMIFLFGTVFTRDDAWKFARAVLTLAIPMTVLIAFQYSLPSTHFVNIAPGGEGTAGFSGAMGKMRPPGTFSFITGLSSFYGLAAAFFAGWLTCGPRPVPRWIWLSAAGMVFALPLSISRTLFFHYALVAIFATTASALAGRAIISFLSGVVLLTVLAAGISQFELFQEAREVFLARWENAQRSDAPDEGGISRILVNRVGGSFAQAIAMVDDVNLFGAGIGLATNVGAVRSIGQKGFVIAEGAWPAMVGELGPILGFSLIAWRVMLALKMIFIAFRQSLIKNTLPLILGGIALQGLVIGQISQPTGLGFLVISAGLMLAACNLEMRRVLVASHQDV
jgi:hypothetical protein